MSSKKAGAPQCPVCAYELDAHAKVVQANGRKVRVCCDECGKKVAAQPAKYLQHS